MKNKEDEMKLLREEKVPAALMKLGIPTMTGMLISALYNAVDAYFVGGLGTSQMGAVSVVFPLVQLIIGLGMMFGAGASSYISRLLGKKEYSLADRTASTALFSGLAVGGLVILAILWFLEPVLAGLGATETILPYARAYGRIYVTGSIINVFTVTMNHLLTAQGAARYTMIAMLSGSILNVILDPIFIYGLDLGIEGAAVATVISLCVNMGLYGVYLVRKKGVLRISVKEVTFQKSLYGEILKIGIPVLAFQLLASISMGLTNTAAKGYGDYAVAAMGAVSRVMTVGTYVVFGFMKGFQPFAGYNYGAGQFGRLQKGIRLCLLWSGIFCGIMTLICLVIPNGIMQLFGSDPKMIALGSKALLVQGVMFLTFGFQMVYASLYLSVGKGLAGSLLSLGRQGIFFIPLILMLPRIWGIGGLLLTQPVADLLAAAVTVYFAAGTNRHLGMGERKEKTYR
jgi:putative MATE family efflux protein